MKYEYGMSTQLKYLQDEIKRCARAVLIDKGYTVSSSNDAIERIKDFHVYETETGYRVEALVDDYKVIVFHHKDEIKVVFSSEAKESEQSVIDRIQKLENWCSCLQSLIDDNRHKTHSLQEAIKVINRMFKWIGENLLGVE